MANANTNDTVLRAALRIIRDDARKPCKLDKEAVAKVCNDALAVPVRNCDVGTVEEQIARFNRFCGPKSCDCIDCPLASMAGRCHLAWAQMPFDPVERKGENQLEANNTKAMRDALEYAREVLALNGYVEPVVRCDAALSKPPRNCDRFDDELDAQLAFLNEVWLISVDRDSMLERDKFENWTDEMRKRYGRWLMAKAAEQKGEAK